MDPPHGQHFDSGHHAPARFDIEGPGPEQASVLTRGQFDILTIFDRGPGPPGAVLTWSPPTRQAFDSGHHAPAHFDIEGPGPEQASVLTGE